MSDELRLTVLAAENAPAPPMSAIDQLAAALSALQAGQVLEIANTPPRSARSLVSRVSKETQRDYFAYESDGNLYVRPPGRGPRPKREGAEPTARAAAAVVHLAQEGAKQGTRCGRRGAATPDESQVTCGNCRRFMERAA